MIAESIKPLTTWLHLNPNSAILLAGIVAFLESLAIVGSIVPGSITLTAIGVLIGSGIIPVWSTFLSAILGAILGDCLSYWLGHHYKQGLRNRWPFNRYPNLIARGEAFFHKHGGKSIFLGRFVGPIRAILPLVAGMLNMPVQRFMLAEILSGILWAPTYMLPGILLGAATLELAPETASWMLMAVLLCIITATTAAWLVRKSWVFLLQNIEAGFMRLWLTLKNHKSLRWVYFALHHPMRSRQHLQLARVSAILLSITLLAILTYSVIHHGVLTKLNLPTFHLLQNSRTPLLNEFFTAVTLLGDKYFLCAFVLLVACLFLYHGQVSLTAYWLANALLVTIFAALMKHGITSPRPTGVFHIRPTSSFPSAHTALATAIYSFLSLLLLKRRGLAWRRVIFTTLGIFLLTIGLSRLYLGAHWLTDVTAGYLLGLGCGLLMLTLYHRFPFQAPYIFKRLWLVSAGVLLITYTPFAFFHYDKELTAYAPWHPQFSITTTDWWRQTANLLPQYRRHRDGTPAVLFNIQWAASLPEIQSHLQNHGWVSLTEPSLINRLANLLSPSKEAMPPFLPPLFQSKPPSLTLQKSLGKDKPILMLHLWKANYSFSNNITPLWLASCHYRLSWKHRWLEIPATQNLGGPAEALLNDLSSFQSRKLAVKSKIRLDYNSGEAPRHIVLIANKSLDWKMNARAPKKAP